MTTGLQNAWSKTAATNASADSNINWAEGMAPSSVNDSARAEMAAVRKWYEDTRGALVTGGTSTAYTLTTNETIALADGVTVTCRMSATCGDDPTLNVDSTGAKTIQTVVGTNVKSGGLISGAIYRFVYYASTTVWVLVGGQYLSGTSLVGRSSGAGTPQELSATSATALLNAFVGDSGSGGTKGLVPAPASGDAAAGKVLSASGSWITGANAFAAGMANGYLSCSVSGNALTIAVKTIAGTDPSASDPVSFLIRSATAANGDFSVVAVTAALSITISSGSTLGTSNNTPFRVWVVAFNDGGTIRLGVVNLWDGAALSLMALDETGVASSTAEGGAGAADSAQTFYTGTAVTNKAYRIIGFIEYASGLATAGTYGSAPTKTQLLTSGVNTPGGLVQEVQGRLTSVSTGTTTIPYDDTIPQNTEGDQYLTQAITPRSAANILEIDVVMPTMANSAAGNNLGAALFQDSTANALAASVVTVPSANYALSMQIAHVMLAGTASATTFKVRAGGSVAGTTTLNGSSAARRYGGVLFTSIKIREIMG